MWHEIDFTYDVEEYGTVLLETDRDLAETEAREYIRETYPDAKNIRIDEVKEITR